MKKFYDHLIHPFKIIEENVSEFFIWILFTVIVQKTDIVYHPQRVNVSIVRRVKVNHPQRMKVNH